MSDRQDAKVFRYTVLTFILVGIAAWGLLQAWATNDIRWLALLIASGGSLAMLIDRKHQHDRLSEPIIIRQSDRPKSAIIEPDKAYTPIVSSHNGQRLKYGKFGLSADEWRRLAQHILKADNRVVRDVVSAAKISQFSSITRRWNSIYSEFERLGLASNGVLTGDGIQFFNMWVDGKIPPTLPTD